MLPTNISNCLDSNYDQDLLKSMLKRVSSFIEATHKLCTRKGLHQEDGTPIADLLIWIICGHGLIQSGIHHTNNHGWKKTAVTVK